MLQNITSKPFIMSGPIILTLILRYKLNGCSNMERRKKMHRELTQCWCFYKASNAGGTQKKKFR